MAKLAGQDERTLHVGLDLLAVLAAIAANYARDLAYRVNAIAVMLFVFWGWQLVNVLAAAGYVVRDLEGGSLRPVVGCSAKGS